MKKIKIQFKIKKKKYFKHFYKNFQWKIYAKKYIKYSKLNTANTFNKKLCKNQV